ncbi:metal ABC transporter permease [Paludibacterium yongneupense]|uniref:metal ABC transporter permease n=1 Tax=Paludibacterium yongneupense TaxID=400061 RepID=UPI000417937E|nr:metal ABC transporter permease [Paludibacterium yongneupense]
MLEYEFMRHALLAGVMVALLAGASGYFLVLRKQTFAGHALSHVGFAGATGAALLGAPPLAGMFAVTVAAGLAMGWLGDRLKGSDVAVGAVLALAMGFGMLFLHFFTAYATQATALLFGNILGVDGTTLYLLAASSLLCLCALAMISRPLIFASLQPELAEARGLPLRLVSMLFLAIVALATALCTQVVGVLLVFALMVGPGAAAQQLTRKLGRGVALAVALALAETVGGIVLAYRSDWPVSFWITALSCGGYLAAAAWRHRQTRRSPYKAN